MNRTELEQRTKRFAVLVIRFTRSLRASGPENVITYQLVKSATSIGANYREATRAQSRSDFIHKLAIVEKESAESQFWLELCIEGGLGDPKQVAWLLQEATELLAIFTRSGRTAKSRR